MFNHKEYSLPMQILGDSAKVKIFANFYEKNKDELDMLSLLKDKKIIDCDLESFFLQCYNDEYLRVNKNKQPFNEV